MDIPDISEEERAAQRYGGRKHDKVSVEVWVAAALGAGAFAGPAFMVLQTTSRFRTGVLMLVAAALGAVAAGSTARVLRTRNAWLLAPVVGSGVLYGGIALAVSPAGSPTVIAMPTVATVLVSSETVGPELQSMAPGSDRTLGAPLTCTVTVDGTSVLPSKECGDRVKVEAFGGPKTGPSAWSLPDSTSLILDSPAPSSSLVRVPSSADGPQCVGQSIELRGVDAEGVAQWMDRVRLVEFIDAPSGTKVFLWSECSDTRTGSGIDNTAGWFLTVE